MMSNVVAVSKLNKLYIRILSTSVLALIGLMAGVIPEISKQSPDINLAYRLTISNKAYAQQFTPEETENYAKAGYQVELLRRKVYQQIKTLINEPLPNIVCDDRSTLDSLQPEVSEIANSYCDRSRQIVQQNNLTVDRFNELKSYYDRQGGFYQQVQSILLKLQN